MAYSTSEHFLPARCYGEAIDKKKKGAAIHHAVGLSLQECYNALAGAGTSTYAAIHHKEVWLLIPDWRRREYSTGDDDGNANYISVELINESIDPSTGYAVADDTIETFCEFIADCVKSGKISDSKMVFGKTKGTHTTLMPHRNFKASATVCPGDFLYSRGEKIAERINALMSPAPVAKKVTLWQAHGKDNQLWVLEPQDGGTWCVRNVAGGYLDITGSKDADGTLICAWPKNGQPNQRFRITDATEKSATAFAKEVNIVSALAGGRVLDAKGAGKANGTEVILYHATGGDNQKWVLSYVKDTPLGSAYLIHALGTPGLVIDVNL
jgi:hypothetical protein